MSETATPEAAAEAKEKAEKAEPKEPLTVDKLKNCTARFTRKAWDLFLARETDLTRIENDLLRAELTIATAEDATTLAQTLKESGVEALTQNGNILSFTATFAQIQTVIKHPATQQLDAIAL